MISRKYQGEEALPRLQTSRPRTYLIAILTLPENVSVSKIACVRSLHGKHCLCWSSISRQRGTPTPSGLYPCVPTSYHIFLLCIMSALGPSGVKMAGLPDVLSLSTPAIPAGSPQFPCHPSLPSGLIPFQEVLFQIGKPPRSHSSPTALPSRGQTELLRISWVIFLLSDPGSIPVSPSNPSPRLYKNNVKSAHTLRFQGFHPSLVSVWIIISGVTERLLYFCPTPGASGPGLSSYGHFA